MARLSLPQTGTLRIRAKPPQRVLSPCTMAGVSRSVDAPRWRIEGFNSATMCSMSRRSAESDNATPLHDDGMLLLDSHRPGDVQIGALGVTHSWQIDRTIAENVNVPVIIAGGLGPDNVTPLERRGRPASTRNRGRTKTMAATQKTC